MTCTSVVGAASFWADFWWNNPVARHEVLWILGGVLLGFAVTGGATWFLLRRWASGAGCPERSSRSVDRLDYARCPGRRNWIVPFIVGFASGVAVGLLLNIVGVEVILRALRSPGG